MKKTSRYLIISAAVLAVAVVVVASVIWSRRQPNTTALLAAYKDSPNRDTLLIEYPLDETLFPPDIAAPTFRWIDRTGRSNAYLVVVEFADSEGRMEFVTRDPQWTPETAAWEAVKKRSLEQDARVTVLGIDRRSPRRVLSANHISIRTSKDEVGAPIFYREVNLPFIDAVKDPRLIRWRFGVVSSQEQPPIVLERLPVCGNCHSFSADAGILGMDVDYANDKGSYAVVPVREDMTLTKNEVITWSDYKREDAELTFGLLSQVSPDGRYVVSTVKDQSVFVPRPDLAFSQLFFPIKGILCIYDRQTRAFQALPGADDPSLVQSNPCWSPDGKSIVFARATAYRLKIAGGEKKLLLSPEDCSEFIKDGKPFLFDLYRIPFNDGKGGTPVPIPGASGNGLSNYFARYSPDGRWIVFCRAKSYMLLQPDSELYIMPAGGGEPRRLRANTSRMNSWHSWSPNGKWLVFSSKAKSLYTQLFLTHIDEQGDSSPAVLLDRFTAPDRAANIPEFVNAKPSAIARIHEHFVDDYSYLRAGIASLKENDPKLAEEQYRKALELNPLNVGAHVDLGYILLNRGETKEGKAHIDEALRLDPNHTYLRPGYISLTAGDPKMAEQRRRKALELNPQDVAAHVDLAYILLNRGEIDEGMIHVNEALRLDPNCAEARFDLGLATLLRNKPEEAAACFERVIQLKPDYAEAHFQLGMLLAKQNKPEEAISHLSRAAQLKPDDGQTHFSLGVLLAGQGKLDDAVAHYVKAAQLKPDDATIPYNLGVTVARQGKLEEAVGYLSRAVQIKPDYIEAYVNLGVISARQNKYDEAIGYLTKAVQINPNHATAHYNLAMALSQAGRHSEAIEHWMQVLRLQPDNIAALRNLAGSYDKTGQTDKAVAALQKALDLARSSGNAPLADQIATQLAQYK
jgi:tetratricopeptide (TPR) repeat protein